METVLINIGLAFLEGLGLILSPCILPILPIVLSGSLEGNKKRPLGITFGFVLTFALFTFFSRRLVLFAGIDLGIIRYASFALLALLGVIMISTYLTEKFARLTQRLTTVGANSNAFNNPQGGFASGILFGALIGLIWTPCAGPILAAVIVQTVLQKTTLSSFFVIFAFGIGAGIPMLLIAIFGRTIMANLTFLKQRTNLLRKLLGVIILASVGLMIYNDSFSASSFGATEKNGENFQTSLVKGLTQPYPAPEITGITHWINSTPLQINQLKGKVVLIDFWTYSCINCIRTLPYIKDWYAKYHDKGLVIIGVHTPEFEFEKNFDNVKKAVEKFGIKYAVALDSNFATWQSFSNQYWPAHYLIDKEGNVVYQHFGEGDYDVTENNIRFLLGLSETTETVTAEQPGMLLTPETYLGYERSATFYSPEKITQDNPTLYTYPQTLPTDDWALKGKWSITAQRIISAEKNASLKLHFHAKKVFIVMGSSTGKPIHVDLRLNGEKVINEKGSDVVDSSIMVNSNTLYSVVDLPESDTAMLELVVSEPGLEVYTFTFG